MITSNSSISRLTLLLVLIFVLWIPIHSTAQNGNNNGVLSQKIEELVAKTVEENDLPGAFGAISDSKGLFAIGVSGKRSWDSTEEITTNDLFHLGSCTKAMTSTLIELMVADGDLSWETTIIEVFPEWQEKIDESYHSVTLHELVRHTGGLPGNATNWWGYTNRELIERRLTIIQDNLKKPSGLERGEFLYSNLGYTVAGSMAERMAGETWEKLITDRLFSPLNMTSAGFGPPGSKDVVDQPRGHTKTKSGWKVYYQDNAEALGPAGRVHSSIEDWAKFVSQFLDDPDPQLLSENQVANLIEPTGEYAAGWGIREREWAKGLTLAHSGSNTMWYVTVWVAPEIDRAFFVGTNSANQDTGQILDGLVGKIIQLNEESQK